MSDKPVFLNSRDLAARLLPDSTDWEVAHVVTALEEIARSHMERRGRTPTIDRASVVKEVSDMNMSESSRQDVIAALERVFFHCKWLLPKFDAEAPSFEVSTLLYLRRLPR
jgi:hypothetical protein